MDHLKFSESEGGVLSFCIHVFVQPNRFLRLSLEKTINLIQGTCLRFRRLYNLFMCGTLWFNDCFKSIFFTSGVTFCHAIFPWSTYREGLGISSVLEYPQLDLTTRSNRSAKSNISHWCDTTICFKAWNSTVDREFCMRSVASRDLLARRATFLEIMLSVSRRAA